MKRILKICDFYGTKFHWYIGYKPKYYTLYGGIFSILSIFCWIIVFILFGLEDFKRTHPIINTSTIPPNGYKNIKFGNQKLYLPWRIVDYDERPLNHKGILYPKIFYFTSKYSNITGAMNTSFTLLNYKLCNETSMRYLGNEFLLDISIEDLYCIDMEDLNMGGSWNAEFMNYIRFDLYLCENGIDYNETNNNCTTYDKFEDLHGKDNSWFFELLYPVVQFQPTEQDIPLLILYKTHYYIFSRYSNKLDRIYLQEHILEDEQGWILNNPHNSSYWGTYSIGGENYVTGEKDILKKGSNSRLYSLKIYLNLGITYYTRKYKKLYEILSDLFPMMRVVTTIFTFLSEIINELHSSKKLNEFIIGIDNNKSKKLSRKNFKKSNNFKIASYNKKNNTFKNNKNKSLNEKNKKLEEQNNKNALPNNLDDSSKIYCGPNVTKDINASKKSMNAFSLKLGLKKSFNNSSFNSYNENKLNFNKIVKIKFPLSYYLLGLLLIKIKSGKFKNSFISDKFSKSFLFFTHLIDISSYITFYKDFNIFKNNILNKLKIDEEELNKKEDILKIKSILNNYNYSQRNIGSNKNLKPIIALNK